MSVAVVVVVDDVSVMVVMVVVIMVRGIICGAGGEFYCNRSGDCDDIM